MRLCDLCFDGAFETGVVLGIFVSKMKVVSEDMLVLMLLFSSSFVSSSPLYLYRPCRKVDLS